MTYHFLFFRGAGEGAPDYVAMAMNIKDEIYNNALKLDLEIDETRVPLREVRVEKDRQAGDVSRAE